MCKYIAFEASHHSHLQTRYAEGIAIMEGIASCNLVRDQTFLKPCMHILKHFKTDVHFRYIYSSVAPFLSFILL